MTANHELNAADRNVQPVPEETGAPEPFRERRFEKCGGDCRPREQKALYPVGTPFAAVIGWW